MSIALRGAATATRLALPLLVGLAAGLRFATLDLQSFDFDEAFTVSTLDGSLGHVFDGVSETESSPPLYYVIAWLWSRLFGLGEVGLRSLSALLGTALVLVAFCTARELAGRRAALIAAALVAVNPLLIFYSQEARTYALFALLCTLSFWAFLVARRSGSTRSIALWAIASSLALLSHYFALFVVLPEAAWLVATRRPRRPTVVAAAAVGAAGAALLPLIADQQADGRTDWISASPLSDRIKEVLKKLLTGELDPTTNWQLAALTAAVASGAGYGLARGTSPERRAFVVAAALGAAALVIPLAVDVTGHHYLVSKNVIPVVPILAIAVAAALGTRRSGTVGPAVAAVACVACAAIAIAAMASPRLRRPDYRAVAADLGAPAANVAVLTPYHGSAPITIYSPGAVAGVQTAQVTELDLVEPLRRGDEEGPTRPITQRPPPGFRLVTREDEPTFTRIRFRAEEPRLVSLDQVSYLSPGTPTFPPVLVVWPGG